MDNKNIFADNLKRYMEQSGKSRKDVCDALGFSYYTFTDWVNGKKYPRMDKVEKLANYFGILKSDLIEDKSETRNNKPASTESLYDPAEEIIIQAYRQADAAGKARIIQVAMNESDRSQTALHKIYRAARSAEHNEHRIEERTASEMEKFKKATPVTSDDEL